MGLGDLRDEFEKEVPAIASLPIKVTNYIENTKVFHKYQPFFYDTAGNFWVWDHEKTCWQMVDDTDMLNHIGDCLGMTEMVVTSGVKNNYLQAFKMVGRKNVPLPAKKSWVQFKDQITDYKYPYEDTWTAEPRYFIKNPIPWTPSLDTECPMIDTLFEEWVGKEYKKTLYEIIAYCCVPDYPIHIAFCLVGHGRNGKSQFIKLLKKFLGSHNICSSSLSRMTYKNTFGRQSLYGKLCCMMGETNFGAFDDTELFKQLTGGDPIDFEFKYKGSFTDENYAKLIIASNGMPTSVDDSDGFKRRWLVIDFPNEFPTGKDIVNGIPDAEFEALAGKVLKLLPHLMERGMFTGQGDVEDQRRRFDGVSNPFPQFIQEECLSGDDYFCKYSDLYQHYLSYLRKKKRRKVKRPEFKASLDQEGLSIEKTTRKVWSDDAGGRTDVNGFLIEGVTLKDKPFIMER